MGLKYRLHCKNKSIDIKNNPHTNPNPQCSKSTGGYPGPRTFEPIKATPTTEVEVYSSSQQRGESIYHREGSTLLRALVDPRCLLLLLLDMDTRHTAVSQLLW